MGELLSETELPELLGGIELPAIEVTTHGESTTYFEPVAAYSSSIVCCCCS